MDFDISYKNVQKIFQLGKCNKNVFYTFQIQPAFLQEDNPEIMKNPVDMRRKSKSLSSRTRSLSLQSSTVQE